MQAKQAVLGMPCRHLLGPPLGSRKKCMSYSIASSLFLAEVRLQGRMPQSTEAVSSKSV